MPVTDLQRDIAGRSPESPVTALTAPEELLVRLRTALIPLAATLVIALSPSAAFAKVTKSPKTATHVLPCNDGSGKTAYVWYNGWNDSEAHPQAQWKSWAVKNWECQPGLAPPVLA